MRGYKMDFWYYTTDWNNNSNKNRDR